MKSQRFLLSLAFGLGNEFIITQQNVNFIRVGSTDMLSFYRKRNLEYDSHKQKSIYKYTKEVYLLIPSN